MRKFLAIVAITLTGCATMEPVAFAPEHPAHPEAGAPGAQRGSALAQYDLPEAASPLDPGASRPRVQVGGHQHGAEAPAGTLYTCPMHPEIIRDAPGECPICGMALVPKMDDGGEAP